MCGERLLFRLFQKCLRKRGMRLLQTLKARGVLHLLRQARLELNLRRD
jgi:hypothetical protein